MQLTPRQQAFFLLLLKFRPKTLLSVLAYIPQVEARSFTALYEPIKGHSPSSLRQVAHAKLARLSRVRSRSYLADVHNDWLLDMLLKESPQMIATVMRYLPAERASAILNSLPDKILDSLPKISDTYSVPPLMVALLRQKFESQFLLHKMPNPRQKFEFSSLCLLNARQLNRVFMETGYCELALALVSLPESTRRTIVERFSGSDRQAVLSYLESVQSAPKPRVKRAQGHLVNNDVHTTEPERFIMELGFLIYARAITHKDREDLKVVQKKMSHHDADALQGMADHYLDMNTEASVVAYQEDIVQATLRVLKSRSYGKMPGAANE